MKALFKFYKLVKAVDSLPAYASLDAVHKEILMAVGAHLQDKELLTVSDVLGMTHLASPATLHGRLKDLRNQGFIEIEAGDDNRFKFLKPSQLANEYFNALGSSLRKAMR
jgi:hypothetical protein